MKKKTINSAEELRQFTLPETYTWKLYSAFGVQEITMDTATDQEISSEYVKRW